MADFFYNGTPWQAGFQMVDMHHPSVPGTPHVGRVVVAAAHSAGVEYSNHPVTLSYGREEDRKEMSYREAPEEGLREYRQRFQSVFDHIRSRNIGKASDELLEGSHQLADDVIALDLHHDNETKHAERLDFWRNFNRCWEALGQQQKKITQEALQTRRQLADVLSGARITSLMNDLVGICDVLHPYGLVD